MKKEEQMIDALLDEHAKSGAGDDVEFLTSLEKKLDEEDSVVQMIDTNSIKKSGRSLGIGIGIAAALAVVAVGYYGANNDGGVDLAVNDSTEASEQLAKLHRDVRKKKDESTAVVTEKLGVQSEASGEKNLLLDNSEEVKGHAALLEYGDDLLLSKDPQGNFQESKTRSYFSSESVRKETDSVIEGQVADSITGKPSVPSSSSARVIPGQAVPSAPLRQQGELNLSAPRWESVRESSDYSQLEIAGQLVGRSDRARGGFESKKRREIIGNRYSNLTDNNFLSPWKAPLSTFSVDVDTASYTNMRRLIQGGGAVPENSVRIEEMVNYFNYAYPQPEGKHPFSVNVETASCPWNTEHRLVKVGLQGKDIIREKRPAANLVFLLDVSGSMNSHDKLPLLVDSMKILLKELNGDDSVSIVVYAGAQGLALPPTFVDEDGRKTILEKLNNLSSGGSTNGGAGITLAYKMAKKQFIKGGVNRVILGTDGDFNVGTTDNASLVSMVEREAKSGVFLSVLGFGQGNLNDGMLESITNKGNGNYSYIDSLREGRKVFLDDMMGNIVTIAKDVKIQVEFNPAKVKSYRLIGYANRILKAEDFKNKRIDAGEIGAGHTVTALYEVVPGNAAEEVPVVDNLKYQKNKDAAPKPVTREVVDNGELMTVKLAYKGPEATKETESTYFNTAVTDSEKGWKTASDDFKFASGVALFGMLQRGSEYSGEGSYQLVRQLAEQGRGEDAKGHRTEFSDLVRKVAE